MSATATEVLKAPFPYFGGKSRIASRVWERFGDAPNYVEPFFGSGAVLFGRPTEPRIETVNDLDGFISNFWRAVQSDPDAVAYHADWPVNENDLHARHAWLVGQKQALQARLEGNPDYFDAKIAGWWVWGISCWIGSGFCSGSGPWVVQEGELIDSRKLPHLGDAGQGVKRQLPHLGTAGRGVDRQLPHLGNAGRGVNRKRPHLGDAGRGYMRALAERLANVRVCCGDWSRVCSPSVTWKHGITAVFLDPPYADTAKRAEVYNVDCMQVAHAVREWAIENGENPLLRIALCGYAGEHKMPDSWERIEWQTRGGYESQSDTPSGNGKKERVWFSPHCISEERSMPLFAMGAT